ncbi:copper transporter 4-like [Panicum virgatum]|nr:copper transporter 4-like [Panicum virgatum]
MAAMPPMQMGPPASTGTPSSPMTMGPTMPPPMDMPYMPAMHMAFFWGHRVEVLFSNWPGDRDGVGMYVLCLLVVLVLAALVEVLSAWSRGLSRRSHDSDALGTLLMTAIHVVKVGLSYLVMLATMSFNGGVFLAVLAGHAAGFFLSRRGVLGHAARDDVHTNGALHHPSEPKP